MLINESREQFERKGEEYNKYGFIINEKEIVPLYDPPHLLKGIRNNFLKADIKFKWRTGQLRVRIIF